MLLLKRVSLTTGLCCWIGWPRLQDAVAETGEPAAAVLLVAGAAVAGGAAQVGGLRPDGLPHSARSQSLRGLQLRRHHAHALAAVAVVGADLQLVADAAAGPGHRVRRRAVPPHGDEGAAKLVDRGAHAVRHGHLRQVAELLQHRRRVQVAARRCHALSSVDFRLVHLLLQLLEALEVRVVLGFLLVRLDCTLAEPNGFGRGGVQVLDHLVEHVQLVVYLRAQVTHLPT